jgi:hypothetical protein
MTFDGYWYLYALIVLGVIALITWNFRRADSILETWADRNGYRIIQKEHRFFAMGPFFWTTSDGQMVYRVVVEDQQGYRRSGWVRCGSWWWGLFTDKAEVRWDD